MSRGSRRHPRRPATRSCAAQRRWQRRAAGWLRPPRRRSPPAGPPAKPASIRMPVRYRVTAGRDRRSPPRRRAPRPRCARRAAAPTVPAAARTAPTPALLGAPPSCPAVSVPGGAACGGPIVTLTDLVACAVCLAGHVAECADHAAVPQFVAYPPECAAPPGTCSPGVECVSAADCPAGYACLDNGSGSTRYCVGPVCGDDGECTGGAVCQQYCTFEGCGARRCVCPGFGCGEAEVCIDDGGLACRELCTEDADCPPPVGVCVNSTFGSGLCINSTPCH